MKVIEWYFGSMHACMNICKLSADDDWRDDEIVSRKMTSVKMGQNTVLQYVTGSFYTRGE